MPRSNNPPGAEVVFNQHRWPVWGAERIRTSIERQRDVYRYIPDQTVRLMNAGLTGPEIAETLQLPKALQDELTIRGYYGTVRHNVKAVYQHYLGWFNAHPANLDPLPPVDAAKRYVALTGALELRQGAPDKGMARNALLDMLQHTPIERFLEAMAASLNGPKAFFLRMVTGGAGAKDLLLSDQTKIDGSKLDLARFFSLIEKAPGTFPIVTR